MKKTALIMITTASMLFAVPGMNVEPSQGKGMQQMKQGKKYCQKKYMKNKMSKKKLNSPFLIKQGLPHMQKMIMPYWHDKDFNLSPEQKLKLSKLKNRSMAAIKETKEKVIALRKDIISGSQTGVGLDILKEKLAELALLESTATLIQLKCIQETKAILSKDQLYFLLVNKKTKCNKKNCKKRSRNNF